MKAVVAAFNQEKALVGAFSVIVQPVEEPMEHYKALLMIVDVLNVSVSKSCSTFSKGAWTWSHNLTNTFYTRGLYIVALII